MKTVFMMVTLVIAAAAMSATASANNIFFSTVNTLDNTVSLGNPTLNFTETGGSATLYIWVTDDTLVDRSMAMDIRVTGPAGVASLTAAQAYNFDLHATFNGTDLGDSGDDRWGSVGTGVPSPTLIDELAAVTAADINGIRAANNGPPAGFGRLDTGYDVAAGAFLFGQVSFDVVGFGTTTISLEPAAIGIFQSIAGNLNSQFTFGSATINVTAENPVPEPASLLLLGMAFPMLGAIANRQNRRKRSQQKSEIWG